MTQCSDIFQSVFDSRVSGCRRTCECGKVYFDGGNDGDWDWHEGELEELRESAKLHPDECFEVDGSVGTMDIDGKEIVIGCSCNLAERFENFILSHSRHLAEYLNKRVEKLKKEAGIIKVSESTK